MFWSCMTVTAFMVNSSFIDNYLFNQSMTLLYMYMYCRDLQLVLWLWCRSRPPVHWPITSQALPRRLSRVWWHSISGGTRPHLKASLVFSSLFSVQVYTLGCKCKAVRPRVFFRLLLVQKHEWWCMMVFFYSYYSVGGKLSWLHI